ncbi:MAG: leucyl aminopeptidase family protein [Pseudomonadota bacterium]
MHIDTDPSAPFSGPSKKAVPIRAMTDAGLKAILADLSATQRGWIETTGFEAKAGTHCMVPGDDGRLAMVLFGTGKAPKEDTGANTPTFDPFEMAGLPCKLPAGLYSIEGVAAADAQLAWGLGAYSYERYKTSAGPKTKDAKTARLAVKVSSDTTVTLEGVYLARDLINTPANDLGPTQLEAAFRKLGRTHKAKVTVTKGDGVLIKQFPMVHAVGRASADAPRVLDLVWGNAKHPKITLVGKGVTFDTGGLNIKPGGSMSLMKKDMGGAANVMGLAHMIMAAHLPVRLRLIVGAVENAIAGNAFRPGDILQTRKGITVEIGNTDAEGRLVLGDCLTFADEEKPELLLDMATLTGAARVALGPDLPPFYSGDDTFSAELASAGNAVHDPLWRMPLWQPYQKMLASKIADVNHISTGGFAGSITAALFLSRFVENAKAWAHFDIFGWVPSDKPWAKTGGEAQAIRALFAVLKDRYPSA